MGVRVIEHTAPETVDAAFGFDPWRNHFYVSGARVSLEAFATIGNLTSRRRARRAAYLIALGTWAVALAIAAAFLLGGCASRAPLPARPTADAQAAAAVLVECVCLAPGAASPRSHGSGVVAGDQVLTAHHVIGCEPGWTPSIVVTTRDGSRFFARVDRDDTAHDLTRLRAAGLDGTAVGIAPVHVGDVVCLASAHPARERSCGVVTRVEPWNLENGVVDIHHTARSIPGNSGSGLYNARGELVGIVTNRNGTGGISSSLYQRFQ